MMFHATPIMKSCFKNIATPPRKKELTTMMMMTTTTPPLKDLYMPMVDYETSHKSH
jgi:hypothetical protein